MKRMDKLRRYYDRLTAVERVNLVLAARDRGDEDEVYQLENVCRAADSFEYESRVLYLGHMANIVVLQLLASEVFTVNMTRDVLDQPGANPGLEHKLMAHLERQAAVWCGFVAWCRDVGHDAHHVLHLAPIGLDERDPACFVVHGAIEQIESWAQDPHDTFPDPGRVQKWRELFAELFKPAKADVGA
jgi:hypothetical protein